ncbi:MAG: TonB family protein [Pontiellaceae bacterium]|nr:TonB family protein [Pontiellaceae bacterium]
MKKTSTFSIAMKVTGIHVGVIGLIVLYSLLNGCFTPEPNNEVVMFVELAPMGPAMGGGAEPTPQEEIAEQDDHEITEVIEEPTPPDDTIPEPPDDSTPEVTDPTPKPPKKDWDPTPASQIPVSDERVVGGRSNPSPNPIPSIDINDVLDSRPSGGTVGSPSEFAAYESRVAALFRRAWNSYKPSSGGPAVIRISFRSSGAITSRRLQRSSGDPAYDAAAQRAADSISSLPRPPSGYGKTYLDIEFELTN